MPVGRKTKLRRCIFGIARDPSVRGVFNYYCYYTVIVAKTLIPTKRVEREGVRERKKVRRYFRFMYICTLREVGVVRGYGYSSPHAVVFWQRLKTHVLEAPSDERDEYPGTCKTEDRRRSELKNRVY